MLDKNSDDDENRGKRWLSEEPELTTASVPLLAFSEAALLLLHLFRVEIIEFLQSAREASSAE